ncbi:MAG: hypothetical protein K6C94_06480 [Candidatus Gastranaerophilales bacterium]|nr:hypothetical protein [Candidatus Gastranaerophilales bacterium]
MAYCKHSTNTLSFHQDNVRFCTTLQEGPVISNYRENAEQLAELIIDAKRKAFEEVPAECSDCIYRVQEEPTEKKITRIDLFYWYHCNCGCFYCSYRDKTKGRFSDEVLEGNSLIYQTVKNLYARDMISRENLFVVWGGGEVGVLKEFPQLMDLFLKNNVNFIWCETSAVRYSDSIAKMLERGKGGMTAAVCCGSRDVYKKIKQRDKYEQVMQNLAKYVRSANKYKDNKKNPENVISKFIILEGFNNNKNEVEKWVLESKKYGLKRIEISMEFCWGIHTKKGQPIEDYNYELFDYAEKMCKDEGLAFNRNDTSARLMEQGIY